MRNLLIFMLLVAVFVLGKRSCKGNHFSFGGVSGKGPIQTETRSASDFHAIDLEIAGDLEVTVGENFAVEVSAQQNLLPLLKTVVENGALRIYTDESFSNSDDIKIRVTAPAFDRFALGGSGTIRILNAIRAEKMIFDLTGSGDIYSPQSDFGALFINIVGSGNVELGGKANEMKADIAGSGDVKAKNLTSNSLKAGISGSGSVTADVSSELRADISGSGDVFYSGNPHVESNVSGSGSVEKMGAQ